MSPRARVILIVALGAGLVAAAAVGIALATGGSSGNERASQAQGATGKPRKGSPPLLLDLGVRTDPAARALARASGLYRAGHLAQAGRIFRRYPELAGRLGAAFSTWPNGSIERVRELVVAQPTNAEARLHLGLALLWAGRNSDAATALKEAARVQPDTPSAVEAANLLHPSMPPGLPQFVPAFRPPRSLNGLSAARQIGALAAAARRGGARPKLLYGVVLQRLGHPVSAEREFAAAAALAPNDPEALTAAAVGRFTKDDPSRAFSRLGPLVRRFPHSASVRFHLGLMLIWLRQFPQARVELALAARDGAGTEPGREANLLLNRLRKSGTG
ncbi:MAG: hypothetical protein QOE36_3589 [Gaiellaceae bacterium]|jgi:tetratricopeptide (TPR) repeat protein|nr:hypothetical protein [Gaiellaceae bacterium]